MKPLPPYARRVEYLESTGTQWIDTGVPANFASQTMSMRVKILSGTGGIGFIVGGDRWKYVINSYGTGTASLTYTRSGGSPNTTVDINTTGNYINFSSNGSYLYVTGLSAKKCNACVSSLTIPLFGYRQNSTTDTEISPSPVSMRLFSWTAKDTDGSFLRSFIPCRILDVGYLWDEVEGKFYGNSGTGDFVLGPDVREGVVPTRLNPFGIGRRQEEIRRVEYLESTGTQWISTPLKISSQGRLQVDASINSWTGAVETLWCARYIGSTSSDIRDALALFKLQNGTLGWDVRPTNQTSRITVTYAGDSNRHSYKQEAGVLYIDGTQVATTTATVTESGGPLYLFVSNFTNGSMNSAVSGRLYSAEYWDADGNLVMKLVPVAIGSTGYLLDRVSGRLFGNQGTGDFVVGPDVVPVEYVESTGSQYVDTGIDPGQWVEVVLDASYDSSGTQGAIVCGTRSPQTTNGRFYILGMDASYNAKTTFGSTNYQSADSGVRRVVDFNTAEHKILWDGVAVANIADSTTVISGNTIFVFSSNGWTTPTMYAAKAKVFSLRIFDAGTLVRDFQPVRVGTEGALYDRITDTVFRSATSTPLVAGPDTSRPAG